MKKSILRLNDSVTRLVGLAMSVIFLMSLSACDDEQEYVSAPEARYCIDVTTTHSEVDSRAAFTDQEDEDGVENYCFLLYNGTGLDAQLIKLIDIDLAKVVMPYYTELPKPGENETWFAVMLGNVTGSELGDAAKVKTDTEAGSTLATLADAHYDIDRQDNLPESASELTWSGSLTVTPSSGNLTFHLNPNVAKVTVNITNNSSESSVTNVRVKNVPSKVRYLQNVIYRQQTDADADNNIESFDALAGLEGLEYLKYDMEKLFMPAKTDAKTYNTSVSWYIPHNLRGEGDRGNGNYGDATDIPDGATYIEIDGVRDGLSSDFVTASYKIYPGTNEYDAAGNKLGYYDMKNFNVVADHRYTIGVNIADDGLTFTVDDTMSGARTPDHTSETNKIKCFPQSNCWFIHPKLQKVNGVTVWELPIDRINEYWRDIAGNEDNTITADSEWQMEVIWQDQNARVIHFCDEYRNNLSDTYHGFGLNPAYITLDEKTLNSSYQNSSRDPITDIYGNVLVGVKKIVNGEPQDGYLWSWHLWVTDYCPDYAAPNTSNTTLWHSNGTDTDIDVDYQGYIFWSTTQQKYVYDYGGNVQHYYHYGSNTWTTLSRQYWNDGMYQGKWIMDRNLGAQAPHNGLVGDAIEGFGLYYQYGRKDPFPFHGADLAITDTGLGKEYPLYDITGVTKVENWKSAAGKVSFADGINNPTVAYHYNGASSGSNSWTSEANTNPWFSPTPVTTGKKTLFDPCPPGWCLPVRDAFDFMFTNNTLYTSSGWTTNETLSKVYIYFGTTKASIPSGKTKHYVRTSIHTGDKLYLQINFPIQGYLSPSSAKLIMPSDEANIDYDYRGYLWTVDPVTTAAYQAPGIGFGIANDNTLGTAGFTKLVNVVNNGVAHSFDDGWPGEGPSIVYDGYWGIDGRAVYKTIYSTSRGHNVRCIQEPNI